MSIAALLGIFLVGLLGGVHCLGMCGGIASALSVRQPGAGRGWTLQLAFNAGRVLTYAAAGAAAGAAGSMSLFLGGVLPVQLVMYAMANLMLVGLGLYLLGITRYVAVLERAGTGVWRRIRPSIGRLMPARTVPRALALGALWGWIPCGLVYSMLATALLAATPLQGAEVMLAFGLGTLPNLLFAGAVMHWLGTHGAGRYMRSLAGGLVLAMGLLGLVRIPLAGSHALASVLCTEP